MTLSARDKGEEEIAVSKGTKLEKGVRPDLRQ